MTTPAFNPISTQFNSVRLYTQFDPYYYTVDNRPLNDMLNNNSTMSKGIDAARMSTLLNALNSDLIDTTINGSGYKVVLGLTPSAPSNLTVRVNVGTVLVPLSVNNSISQTILKKGMLQEPVDLSYTAPVTVGESIVYTVEYRYVDVSASTTSSNFIDAGNSVQFDTSLDGILELQIIAGTSATTGSEVQASTSGGWFPLYNLHIANGQSNYNKIYFHDNAPKLYSGTGLRKELSISLPVATPGSLVTTLDPIPAWELSNGATESIVSSFEVAGTPMNQFKDIQFDLEYTSPSNTGNFELTLEYAVIKEGETLSGVSFTASPAETTAAPGTANTLKTSTLDGVIPGHVLQDAKKIAIKLSRLGGSGSDTCTGVMLVTGLTAKQV